MLKPFLSLMFLITLSSACGEEDITEKGDEEQALTGGKSDSFFKPTNHGELNFGVPSTASISSDARFHAWTFTLSDDAKVTLKTDVSRNLDTVMYLYKRDNPMDSWGRYIKKNDDHKGNIWSQITLSGEAAQYRVIVKPFKKALKGSFDLNATCDGAGCASLDAGQCEPKLFDSPNGLPYTDVCATKIMNIAMSPQVSSSSGTIAYEKHCQLGGVEQLAIAHYVDFFEGFVDVEDFFDFGSPIDFEFDHVTLERGHEITVDGGGDENAATLFYDNDLNLIALYQHNQSPTVDYYCGESMDTKLNTEPDPDCVAAVLFDTPATDEMPLKTTNGELVLDELEGEDFLASNDILFDFTKTYKTEIKNDTPISFIYFFYGERENNTVSELKLSIAGKPAITYNAYSDFNGVMLVRTVEGVSDIRCEK